MAIKVDVIFYDSFLHNYLNSSFQSESPVLEQNLYSSTESEPVGYFRTTFVDFLPSHPLFLKNLKRSGDSFKPKTEANAVKRSRVQSVASNSVVPSVPAGKIDVSSMMSVVQSMSSDIKTFRCSFCGFESAHKVSTSRHIETKHLPNAATFSCRTCSYSSKHKHALKKHYMSVHDMPEPAAQAMLVC